MKLNEQQQYWAQYAWNQAVAAGHPDPGAFVGKLYQESRFNPSAIGPQTRYGTAKGMAQFIDTTAAQYGIDPMDPRQAIEGSIRYDMDSLNRFGGDTVSMLAAYNAGPGNVANGKWKGFKETTDYVDKITNQWAPAFNAMFTAAPLEQPTIPPASETPLSPQPSNAPIPPTTAPGNVDMPPNNSPLSMIQQLLSQPQQAPKPPSGWQQFGNYMGDLSMMLGLSAVADVSPDGAALVQDYLIKSKQIEAAKQPRQMDPLDKAKLLMEAARLESQQPASVKEYQYYASLSPAEQARYTQYQQAKIQPNWETQTNPITGQMVQVDKVTGATRPIGGQGVGAIRPIGEAQRAGINNLVNSLPEMRDRANQSAQRKEELNELSQSIQAISETSNSFFGGAQMSSDGALEYALRGVVTPEQQKVIDLAEGLSVAMVTQERAANKGVWTDADERNAKARALKILKSPERLYKWINSQVKLEEASIENYEAAQYAVDLADKGDYSAANNSVEAYRQYKRSQKPDQGMPEENSPKSTVAPPPKPVEERPLAPTGVESPPITDTPRETSEEGMPEERTSPTSGLARTIGGVFRSGAEAVGRGAGAVLERAIPAAEALERGTPSPQPLAEARVQSAPIPGPRPPLPREEDAYAALNGGVSPGMEFFQDVGRGLLRTAEQIGQGFGLGFVDEAAGVVGGAVDSLQTGVPFSEAYPLARDSSRERFEEGAQALGAPATVLSQGLGGLPVAGARLAAAPLKTGAGIGALAGLGGAEGSVEEQAGQAALGSLLGVATPVVAGGLGILGQGAKRVGQLVTGQGARGEAERMLGARLQGMRPAQANMPLAARSEELGQVAEGLAQRPETRGVISQAMEAREAQSLARRQAAVKQAFGADQGQFSRTIDDLIKTRADTAGPLYKQFVTEGRLNEDTAIELLDFVDSREIGPYLKKAQRLVRQRGEGGTDEQSLQVWDALKRQLDDKASSAARAGNKNEASIYSGLSQELRGKLDAAVPEYAQARAAYAEPTQLKEAVELGRDYLKTEGGEAIIEQYSRLSTPEQEMFRVGMARKLYDEMGKTDSVARVYSSIMGGEQKRAALKEVLGPQAYEQFASVMEQEKAVRDLANSLLQNSSTARRQEIMGQLAGPESIQGLVSEAINAPVKPLLQTFKRRVNTLLADTLMETDPAKQQMAIDAAMKRVQADNVFLSQYRQAAQGVRTGIQSELQGYEESSTSQRKRSRH